MSGILPAKAINEWGTYAGYIIGKVRTNLGIIEGKRVTTRPDALVSIDIVITKLDGKFDLIECFDLKLVTLTRQSDRAQEGVQQWCLVGNKDFYLVRVFAS